MKTNYIEKQFVKKTPVPLQNLLEKVDDVDQTKENSLFMVQSKVLKHLALLDCREFDDSDITDDIAFLNERLIASIHDLRWAEVGQRAEVAGRAAPVGGVLPAFSKAQGVDFRKGHLQRR